MRRKFKANDRSVFDDIVRELLSNCDIRQHDADYIQTYCGICVGYVGNRIVTPAVISDTGEVIENVVLSDYILFDAIVPNDKETYFNGLTDVYPENPIHNFS